MASSSPDLGPDFKRLEGDLRRLENDLAEFRKHVVAGALSGLEIKHLPVWFRWAVGIFGVTWAALVGTGIALLVRVSTLEERVPKAVSVIVSEFEQTYVRPIRESQIQHTEILAHHTQSLERIEARLGTLPTSAPPAPPKR